MKKLALLFAAMLCLSGFGTTANAISISIGIGDQPYYIHGPGYWYGRIYYVWIPGHWNRYHTVWIHGHYAPRGY
jgi:hypothetical protein